MEGDPVDPVPSQPLVAVDWDPLWKTHTPVIKNESVGEAGEQNYLPS